MRKPLLKDHKHRAGRRAKARSRALLMGMAALVSMNVSGIAAYADEAFVEEPANEVSVADAEETTQAPTEESVTILAEVPEPVQESVPEPTPEPEPDTVQESEAIPEPEPDTVLEETSEDLPETQPQEEPQSTPDTQQEGDAPDSEPAQPPEDPQTTDATQASDAGEQDPTQQSESTQVPEETSSSEGETTSQEQTQATEEQPGTTASPETTVSEEPSQAPQETTTVDEVTETSKQEETTKSTVKRVHDEDEEETLREELSGEEATEAEEETGEEIILIEVEELLLDASTKQKYAVANKTPVQVELDVAGGMAPYTMDYVVAVNGMQVAFSVNAEFTGQFTYMPQEYGDHAITILVRDALGTTVEAQLTVPVAEDEREDLAGRRRLIPKFTKKETFDEKLAQIARSQLGYAENKHNFLVNEEDEYQYYSFFGDWFGTAYKDWNAAFVYFCLTEAGVPKEAIPHSKDVDTLKRDLQRASRYIEADKPVDKEGTYYTPKQGDLVFYKEKDAQTQEESLRVGIVYDVYGKELYVITGDRNDEVAVASFTLGDRVIDGYVDLAPIIEKFDANYVPPVELVNGKVEKTASLGNDYSVVVRYAPDAGIPVDAQLSVKPITDSGLYADYLDSAKSELEEGGKQKIQQFFLLDISLISDGVNYAGAFNYEVEVVLNTDIQAKSDKIRAMRFDDNSAQLLDVSVEEGAGNTAKSIHIQSH